MSKKIKYPIGIQTFRKIVEGGYLYVDKTAMVHELANTDEYVFLSRPRRFGKSLLMSTLESYFKGERELFEGLMISELETEWREYPVLRFDLSPTNYNDPQRLTDRIESCLRAFEKDYSVRGEGNNVAERFANLIAEICRQTGMKVVILVDEYDKPLLDCLHDPCLHGTLRNELRGFYSVIKASDRYIRFAMLTGITKFGKVSVFSGLNNLRDISLIPKYNAICGITETEFHRDFGHSIAAFAEEHGITEEEAWRKFKTMYDGYHFSTRGEFVYNPFSVLNAFNDGELNDYWYESGSPSYLIRLIERNAYPLDTLEGARRTNIAMNDISDTDRDLVPLLYQSGYLTIKGYDEETEEYVLGFPNREVNKSFWSSLADRFFRGIDGRSAFNVRDCVRDILEGNADGFMIRMKALFADISSEPEKSKEIHFQNMMAIAAKMLGLSVRTEVHSSMGRCDMQIQTDRFVYIFEFKIDGSAQEAMAQIHEKGYAVPFSADGRSVILIGADFRTDTRTLGHWIIENFEK
ncbi:MAG: ATP-binding protein [Muribaculaceae bacterium]|nr:ATP-binding protein [Muribaculaceae bacterium]